MTNCNCEHQSHFQQPRTVHGYGAALPTLPVKTDWGTFELCEYCRTHCQAPVPTTVAYDLRGVVGYTIATAMLRSIFAPLYLERHEIKNLTFAWAFGARRPL